MKKILVAVVFGLMAIAAQAEATFDQIQGLIEQHQYQAAASGLETIIQNHPKSAKAFYAMAQAQAGLGNLEKANKALTIATGLNPTLDFAPASSVASLKQAITPQVAKIETIEESHFWRNFMMGFILFAVIGFIAILYKNKKDEEEGDGYAGPAGGNSPSPSPITPTAKKEVAEKDIYASSYTPRAAYRGTPRTVAPTPVATPAPAPTQVYGGVPTHTTVVNNNSSNDGLLTGVILGNMMSNHHDHHEREVVRERVIEREVPAPRSSWDDIPAETSRSSSRSSSWDDAPSKPSRSSSWDDDSSSSSKSSSSWSSSSSSDSSSSWDSGSSSSSDSSSSSSWD